jgi:hypothetical protein
MSSVIIAGNVSGTITLDAPNVAGTTTLTLPTTTDTLVGRTTTDTLTNKTLTSPVMAGTPTGVGVLTAGTAVSASGTSVDFTGIPSWVKRISIVYSGLSTNGSSSLLIQLGDSGGIETTGYISTTVTDDSTGGSAGTSSTSGFLIWQDSASYATQGIATIINITGNNWVLSQAGRLLSTNVTTSAGDKTLSATLDRVRITTANGTDAFDAGSINILYE